MHANRRFRIIRVKPCPYRLGQSRFYCILPWKYHGWIVSFLRPSFYFASKVNLSISKTRTIGPERGNNFVDSVGRTKITWPVKQSVGLIVSITTDENSYHSLCSEESRWNIFMIVHNYNEIVMKHPVLSMALRHLTSVSKKFYEANILSFLVEYV